MYAPDTILTLKDPRSEPGKPFPYDRVRVIGQSPVDHGLRSSQWSGNNGQGVIVTPLTDFDSTIDEPYGKLQRLYDVEALPQTEIPIVGTVEIRAPEEAGPSPEDVFASVTEAGDEDGRAAPKPRQPVVSPLDGEVQGVDVPPSDSPLGSDAPDGPPVGEFEDDSPL